MKKWVAIGICLIIVLSLSSCGSDSVDNSSQSVQFRESSSLSVEDIMNSAMSQSDEMAEEASKELEEIESSLKTAESTSDVDIDLTVLSGSMVYAQVSDMMYRPMEYLGKTVRMSGAYSYYHDATTGNDYFACVVRDATACCANGIEFVLTEDYLFPDDYPEPGAIITVVGVFDTYKEGNSTYCTLREAKLE